MRQRFGVSDMQHVVNRSHRRELDRRVADPVEDVAIGLTGRDTAQIVNADVPAEAVSRKAVRQPAESPPIPEPMTMASQRCAERFVSFCFAILVPLVVGAGRSIRLS